MHVAQIKNRAHFSIVDQLGKGVRNTARAYIVNAHNWIFIAELPATVNHFLCAALQLWVASLHRIKIEIFGVATSIHAACSAAA